VLNSNKFKNNDNNDNNDEIASLDNGLMFLCFQRRSSAVEQLLEKNYRIHCSVNNIVSASL